MNTNTLHRFRLTLLALSVILAVCVAALHPQLAYALPATTCTEASGIRTCDLWAKAGTLTLPGSVTANIWGYAADSISPAGIPGPMLIMNQGETLQVVLHNGLTEATSLTVPGA
ncbi:MAG TPA: hypothetical protein PKI78_09655, partial [Anaerolineales bacterium]|nr:hypothetical protein [Anaerolineales bacterium]